MNARLAEEVNSGGARLGHLSSSLLSQLPGLSFFLGVAPPAFPAITLLLFGGTLTIFFLKFTKRPSAVDCARKASRCIAGAIALAAIYGFLFHYTTVEPPAIRNESARIQVGFGLSTFSLQGKALKIAEQHHLATKQELMLAFGAYGDDANTSLIWKPWSVLLAGSLLIVLFCATYWLWVSGLGWLACASRPSNKVKAK
jgi:hypothetical protein